MVAIARTEPTHRHLRLVVDGWNDPCWDHARWDDECCPVERALSVASARSRSRAAHPSSTRMVEPDRVYRRRRLAVLVAGLVLAVAAIGLVDALVQALGGRVPDVGGISGPTEPSVVVVEPGDTVWSIAAGLSPPGTDMRATVDALISVNDGPALAIGQRFVIAHDGSMRQG